MKQKELLLSIALVIFCIVVVIAFFFLSRTIVSLDLSAKPTPMPQPVSSDNIIIYSPSPSDQVSQTFQIVGSARVFENRLSIRIRNPITDKVYLTDTLSTKAQEMGKFGNFTYTVNLDKASSLKSNESIVLDIFANSPKDGSEIDTVSLPLLFVPR